MKCINILLFFLCITNASMAQLKKFTIEVPQQPKFELSDSIQSFTIMNRSISPEFKNFADDSLQVEFYRKNFDVNTLILDSLVADTTIKAMGEVLFESERFDVVIPVDRNISRFIPFSDTPEPLEWPYVRSLCDLYQTDALIVLENLATRVVSDYQKQKEFIQDGFYTTYYASIDVYYRAHWRIYDPIHEMILVDYIDTDTTFWDSYEYSFGNLFKNLPSVKQACLRTGVKSAINFSDVIAPVWEDETRYYYILKDNNIDQSIKYASNGEWQSALDNWLKYVDHSSNPKKSKVMLNVALAYEMLGDVDNAISWCYKSQEKYYREVTNHYLKLLIKRKEKKQRNN